LGDYEGQESRQLETDSVIVPLVLIPSLVLMYFVFSSPLFVVFGLELAALLFFIVHHFVFGRTYSLLRLRRDVYVLAIAIVTTLSASILWLTKHANPYYSLFSSIPPTSWVFFGASVLVSNFLVGYLILAMLRIDTKVGVTGCIILSYALSYFATSTTAFVLLSTGRGLIYSYVYTDGLAIALSLIIIGQVVFSFRGKQPFGSPQREGGESRTALNLVANDASLALGFLVLLLGTLYFFIDIDNDIPFLKGDLLGYFGGALRYLLPGWQFAASNLSYPNWFQWNLVTTLNSSNFPLLNQAVVFSLLDLMLVFAFVYFARSISRDSGTALMATTMFILFGGLEWILLMLGSSSSAAHSRSFFGNPLLYYTWDYKDVEVALICVVAMLGIIYDKRLYWKEKAFLVFPAFTTAFLVHIQEAGLFLIIFLPVYLVTSKDGLAAKISILLSFVGSLLFAILVNTLVSIPLVVGTAEDLIIIPSLLLGALLAVKGVRSIAKSHFGSKIWFSDPHLTPGGVWSKLIGYGAKKSLAYLGVYLYGLTILAFLAFPNMNMIVADWQFGSVPLTLYWIRLGIVIPASLAGVIVFLHWKVRLPRWVVSMILATIAGIVVTELISLLNMGQLFDRLAGNYTGLPTGIWPWRILTLLFIPLTVLSGYFVSVGSRYLSMHRWGKCFVAIFVAGMVLVGMPTTFLIANSNLGPTGGIGIEYTTSELDAMNWMRVNIPLNSVVLTSYPRGPMLGIASAKLNQPLENFSTGGFSPLMFQSTDPNFVLGLLSYYNVSYVFVDQYDWNSIHALKNSFMVNYLLPMLPVVFNDSNNVVFRVDPNGPSIDQLENGNSSNSSGAAELLLSPLYMTDNYAFISSLLGYSSNYASIPVGASLENTSHLAILTYDPEPALGVNDSELFITNSTTVGDTLEKTNQSLTWSLDTASAGTHSLRINLQSFASTSDLRTIKIYLRSSFDRSLSNLSCSMLAQNQTNILTVLTFHPRNGSLSGFAPPPYGSQLRNIYINCQVPSGLPEMRAFFSISNVTFTTYEDAQSSNVPFFLSSTIWNPSSYLGWVERGGTLIVVDPGLPVGYFGRTLSIQEEGVLAVNGVILSSSTSSFSGSSNTSSQNQIDEQINITSSKIISSPLSASNSSQIMYSGTYSGNNSLKETPLAIQERVGNGTLVWLNFGPVLSLIRAHKISIVQASYFLRESLLIYANTFMQNSSDPLYPTYDAIIRSPIALTGLSMIFGSGPLAIVGKTPQNLSGSFGFLSNYTIQHVYMEGSTRWVVSSTNATIQPGNIAPGMQTIIYPQGASIEIISPSASLSPIIVTATSGDSTSRSPMNYTSFTGLNISTSQSEKLVLASPLLLRLDGTMNSSNVRVSQLFYGIVSTPPYGYSLRNTYSRLVLAGNFTLATTNYMDGMIVFATGGNWHTVNPYSPSVWNIGLNDWISLLKTRGNFILLFSVLGLALVDYSVGKLRSRNGFELEYEIEDEKEEEEERQAMEEQLERL
jgi:hypothetical protein